MSTVLCVSGSQRRGSWNSRLLREMAGRLDGRCDLDILHPADVDLPLFDQDLESTPVLRARMTALHRRVEASDGLLVASPEYNGQLTPYLKNLIDWISRLAHVDRRFHNPFDGRAVLLCSASTGTSGGAVGLSHARALFEYVGCTVTEETVCVPYVSQAWTGDRFEFDPFFDDDLSAVADHFLEAVEVVAHVRMGRIA